MNTAEIQQTTAEIIKARTLANITRRAQTLFADGYTAREVSPDNFFIVSPKGDEYVVTLTDTPTDEVFGDRCTCPAFGNYGECKHHLAVLAHKRDEEQAAEYDARDAYDPYALRH